MSDTPIRLYSTIRRRRRQAGEFATAAASIRNHRLECMGYDVVAVDGCTAPACWLYPWRFGRKPATAQADGRQVDFASKSAVGGSYGAQNATEPTGRGNGTDEASDDSDGQKTEPAASEDDEQ